MYLENKCTTPKIWVFVWVYYTWTASYQNFITWLYLLPVYQRWLKFEIIFILLPSFLKFFQKFFWGHPYARHASPEHILPYTQWFLCHWSLVLCRSWIPSWSGNHASYHPGISLKALLYSSFNFSLISQLL